VFAASAAHVLGPKKIADSFSDLEPILADSGNILGKCFGPVGGDAARGTEVPCNSGVSSGKFCQDATLQFLPAGKMLQGIRVYLCPPRFRTSGTSRSHQDLPCVQVG